VILWRLPPSAYLAINALSLLSSSSGLVLPVCAAMNALTSASVAASAAAGASSRASASSAGSSGMCPVLIQE
jgi:hypothetical protein